MGDVTGMTLSVIVGLPVYFCIGAIRRAMFSYWIVPIPLAVLVGFVTLKMFGDDLAAAVVAVTLLGAAFRRIRAWPWTAIVALSWVIGWIGGAIGGAGNVVPVAIIAYIVIRIWLKYFRGEPWDASSGWDSHGHWSGQSEAAEFAPGGGDFGGGGASGGWGDGGGDGGDGGGGE